MVAKVEADRADAEELVVLDHAVEQLPAGSPVRALLASVSGSLALGKGVTLVEKDAVLSPNQAAELIGISRPFLLNFMKSGALSFSMVGTHRRISLSDLLEFDERRRAAGKLVAEAAANATSRESAAVQSRAPLSDRALGELDDL